MAKKNTSRPDHDPRWSSELTPAPGDLRIVQAFVNTGSLGQGTEWSGPEELAGWLALWELMPPDAELDGGDVDRAVEVRATLWALADANGGVAVDRDALVRLDQAVAPATMRMCFAPEGRVRFEPAVDGFDGALARLCSIVATAQLEDRWKRMKVCADPTCQAVYFDRSKNRSAKYCSRRCGSRSGSVRYRHRNLERVRKNDKFRALFRRELRRYGLRR